MKPNPPGTPDVPMAEPVAEADTRAGAGMSTSGELPAVGREPRVGDQVGPYPILGELGRGGMAVVYRSKDPALPREIALKVMLPKVLALDPGAKERFAREAGAQAKVENPHVVAIYQLGEWNGVPFIAMPALKGRALSDRLKELKARGARFPIPEVIRIGREIAEGLEAAHAVGLVHRDIKPGNIWLEEPKGWVKLLDFGLAREEAPTPMAGGDKLGTRKAIVGTPSYMSPEQATGGFIDARTDLWSLGVILYQMAAGEKPFTGATRADLIRSVIQDEPLPPDTPDVPPALADLVMRLLAKRPEDRLQTAAEVVAALAAIEKGLHAPAAPVLQLPADAAPEVWSSLDEPAPPELTAPPARARKSDPPPEPAREKKARPKPTAASAGDRPAPRAKPRAWLWAVAGVLGVAVVGGAWLALKPKPAPKPEDLAAAPKPSAAYPEKDKKTPDARERKATDIRLRPPPPLTLPTPADDRQAAITFREKLATVVVVPDGGKERTVRPDDQLPEGKFALVAVDFGNHAIHAGYPGDTLLPAVGSLRSLARVQVGPGRLGLTAEQVQAMTAMPFAPNLERLDLAVEATPKAVAELRKFGKLKHLTCRVPSPDNTVLTELGKLKLQSLTLVNTAGKESAEKGWAELGKKSFKLTLVSCPLDAPALRALAGPGARKNLAFGGGAFENADLYALGAFPSGLEELKLSDLPGVNDEGLAHLARLPGLKKLVVERCAVSDEGVAGLKAAAPGLTVEKK